MILGARHGGEFFNNDDLDILDVVARQARIALENTRLITDLRQHAQESERLHRQALRAREEERKRLARELHDQIIQALVGLNYHLADMGHRPTPGGDGRVSRLQGEVRGILDDVRRICWDLRPPALDSLGLVSAVRGRLRELETESSLKATLAVEGDAEQSLPEDVELTLFRVLQEALLNVRKHAAAQRVEVRLQVRPEEIILTVQDDGQGFVVPQRLRQLTHDGHFGLVGLRERLELVRGTLQVTSAPGEGTRLEAWAPLAPE